MIKCTNGTKRTHTTRLLNPRCKSALTVTY